MHVIVDNHLTKYRVNNGIRGNAIITIVVIVIYRIVFTVGILMKRDVFLSDGASS